MKFEWVEPLNHSLDIQVNTYWQGEQGDVWCMILMPKYLTRGCWEAVFWMIRKTGSSPDPGGPLTPRWLPKDDSMWVVFGREYGPVRCHSSIFVAFLCGEWKLFQMSRCFAKMSCWFGFRDIEFCIRKRPPHLSEDAQNLMGAPLHAKRNVFPWFAEQGFQQQKGYQATLA